MTLRQHLFDLARHFGLNPAQGQALHNAAGMDAQPAAANRLAVPALTLLAAVMAGFGVILWIAANWGLWERPVHFALLGALLLASSVGSWALARFRAASLALGVLADDCSVLKVELLLLLGSLHGVERLVKAEGLAAVGLANDARGDAEVLREAGAVAVELALAEVMEPEIGHLGGGEGEGAVEGEGVFLIGEPADAAEQEGVTREAEPGAEGGFLLVRRGFEEGGVHGVWIEPQARGWDFQDVLGEGLLPAGEDEGDADAAEHGLHGVEDAGFEPLRSGEAEVGVRGVEEGLPHAQEGQGAHEGAGLGAVGVDDVGPGGGDEFAQARQGLDIAGAGRVAHGEIRGGAAVRADVVHEVWQAIGAAGVGVGEAHVMAAADEEMRERLDVTEDAVHAGL